MDNVIIDKRIVDREYGGMETYLSRSLPTMSNVTHEDVQELISAIVGLRDAITDIAATVGTDDVREAIADGVDRAFNVDTQDVREAIAGGVNQAFGVYPSDVMNAIADGTREALGGKR